MKRCKDKLHHKTEREALDHLSWARKQPNGKGLRELNVYQCECGGWCVGRAWRGKKQRQALAVRQEKPTQHKPLTPGQARREAARAQREAERHAKRAELFKEYAENMEWARQETERLLKQLGRTQGAK